MQFVAYLGTGLERYVQFLIEVAPVFDVTGRLSQTVMDSSELVLADGGLGIHFQVV